ncbi:hypothetical protein EYF80_016758 [Liparis tanakae]|uniref:Ig-like domain-containing protein n=1 Tax=Liparis tanakae TaxID=230148 RepID=A0A4Z2I544_9TELE|nr:hypothetical protein EYF80_016758 [Liparis tanakae]
MLCSRSLISRCDRGDVDRPADHTIFNKELWCSDSEVLPPAHTKIRLEKRHLAAVTASGRSGHDGQLPLSEEGHTRILFGRVQLLVEGNRKSKQASRISISLQHILGVQIESCNIKSPEPCFILQRVLHRNKEDRVQCPGEHRVHWFRSGSGETQPGFIHTHSDAPEERSCDFSLSKTIHDSSDTGTYYCAVATCGEILFGGGTKVDTKQELRTPLIVLATLLACCVINARQ